MKKEMENERDRKHVEWVLHYVPYQISTFHCVQQAERKRESQKISIPRIAHIRSEHAIGDGLEALYLTNHDKTHTFVKIKNISNKLHGHNKNYSKCFNFSRALTLNIYHFAAYTCACERRRRSYECFFLVAFDGLIAINKKNLESEQPFMNYNTPNDYCSHDILDRL